MKNSRSILCLWLIGFIIYSCEPDSIAESENIQVVHSSICFCAVFQETTVQLEAGNIQKERISKNNAASDLLCSGTLQGSDWNKILQNLNIEEFIRIPDTLGCPNCRDEGAQILRINTQHTSHQVTWSNDVPPDEMGVLLQIISDLDLKYFRHTDCR